MISSCSSPWYDQFLLSESLTPSFASWIAHAEFETKVAAAGQSIAVAKQVQAGLGRHISTLTASQVEHYQKVGVSVQSSEHNNFFWLTVLHWADRIHFTAALCFSPVSSKVRCLTFSFDHCHYQDMPHHLESHCSCELRLGSYGSDYGRFAVRFVSTMGYPIKSMLWSGQSERVGDQTFAEIQVARYLGFHRGRWYCRQPCNYSFASLYPLWPSSTSK